MERLTLKCTDEPLFVPDGKDLYYISDEFGAKCLQGEVVDRLAAFEDTNLEPSEILALKAENARLNANKVSGCAWCKGDWTDNFSVIDENFGQPLTYRHVKFCPMCGIKLRSPAEERKDDGQ